MVFPLNFRDMFGGNNPPNNPERNTGGGDDPSPVRDDGSYDRLDQLNDTQQKQLNNFSEFNTRDKKADKIRTPKEKLDFKLSKIWDKLKLNKLFPALFGVLGKIASGIGSMVSGVFGDIMELMLYALVDPKGSLLVSFINALIPLFMNLIVLVTNVFISVIPTILKVFLNALPKIIELLVNAFVAVMKMVPEIIKILIKSMPMIIKAITKAVPIIIKAFGEALTIIKNELLKQFPEIKEFFKFVEETTGKIKDFFIDMYDKSLEIYDKIKKYSKIGKDKVKEIYNTIFSDENIKIVSDYFEKIKNRIMNFLDVGVFPLFQQIYDSFNKHMIPMKDSFVKIFKSIAEVFESDMDGTYKYYLKLVQGTTSIVEPLFENFDNILKKFADNLESITPIIKDTFHVMNKFINSILSKFFQVLPGLIDSVGFIIGIIIDFAGLMIEILAPVVLFIIDVIIDLADYLWIVAEVIWDVMSIFLKPVFYLLEGLWAVISKILWPIVKFIFKVLFGAFKFLYSIIKDIFMGSITFMRDIIQKIKGLFDDIKIPSIGNLIQKAIDMVLKSSFVQKTIGIFESVFIAISRYWKNFKRELNVKDRLMNNREFNIGKTLGNIYKNSELDFNPTQVKYIEAYVRKGKDVAQKEFGASEDVIGMTEELNKIGENILAANGGKAETEKLFSTEKTENLLEKLNKTLKDYLDSQAGKSGDIKKVSKT